MAGTEIHAWVIEQETQEAARKVAQRAPALAQSIQHPVSNAGNLQETYFRNLFPAGFLYFREIPETYRKRRKPVNGRYMWACRCFVTEHKMFGCCLQVILEAAVGRAVCRLRVGLLYRASEVEPKATSEILPWLQVEPLANWTTLRPHRARQCAQVVEAERTLRTASATWSRHALV